MPEFEDFFTFDPVTAILSIINLLILTLFLRHFLFNKVNNVIEERQKAVKDAYDNANAAQAKANELEATYNQKILAAKDESAEIIKNATKKAQLRSDEIVSDAKNEASSIISRANQEIEREKKRAVNDIKDQISDIAFTVAEKVIEKEIDTKDNERLIDEFINNVGEL